MEKILQIVGAKLVENKMVKLVLIPYSSPEVRKKKESMLKLAISGVNVQDLVKQVQGDRQQLSKIFITQDEWLNVFKNKLFSTIKISFELEEVMPDR